MRDVTMTASDGKFEAIVHCIEHEEYRKIEFETWSLMFYFMDRFYGGAPYTIEGDIITLTEHNLSISIESEIYGSYYYLDS